jgi:hypothetical protein
MYFFVLAKKFFCRFYEFLKYFGLEQKKNLLAKTKKYVSYQIDRVLGENIT